jgi:hypothetical protein
MILWTGEIRIMMQHNLFTISTEPEAFFVPIQVSAFLKSTKLNNPIKMGSVRRWIRIKITLFKEVRIISLKRRERMRILLNTMSKNTKDRQKKRNRR